MVVVTEVVTGVVTGVEKGVDAARASKDVGHEQITARPPSVSMMGTLSPRCREDLALSVKMIRLQHDTMTCIFSLLLFPVLNVLLFRPLSLRVYILNAES